MEHDESSLSRSKEYLSSNLDFGTTGTLFEFLKNAIMRRILLLMTLKLHPLPAFYFAFLKTCFSYTVRIYLSYHPTELTMFNRKISKKFTNSQRNTQEGLGRLADHDELEMRKIHATVNQSHDPRIDIPDFQSEEIVDKNLAKRSQNRIAAGFISRDPDASTSRSQRRGPHNFSEDDFPSDRSTNEIQEEFDVDDAENFQYPTAGVLAGELLLEEYSELVNDSADDIRGTDQSQVRLPVPMSPQVSKVPFRSETIQQSRSQNSRNSSNRQLDRRSSRSLPPKMSPRAASITRSNKEFSEDDEDEELTAEPDVRNSYIKTSTEYSQQPLNSYTRLSRRSSSKNSRRGSTVFNASETVPPAGFNTVSNSLNRDPNFVNPASSSVNSASSFVNPNSGGPGDRQTISYPPSNNRLNSNANSIPNANIASRDVVPLPIEIPDNVTDADAFRRYLSRSTVESLGGRPSNQYPVGARRSPSQMIPASFVSSSASLSPIRPPPPDLGQNSITLPEPNPSNNPAVAPCGCISHANAVGLGHKRTASLSHAIMTLALLSASAAQLRFVVAYSHAHAYPTLNYFLICSCIIIEVLVGIGFVVLARFDFSEAFQDKLHSYLIFGLFVITVANVIVAAFALDDHICEVLMKRSITEGTLPNSMQQQPYFDDTRLNRFNDPLN
ncbi:unnamed protein product [Allacma fusca]|uniref:Uncharacterized protein n=1 Tax=Allacma fusca TaxID=39272 RepID=A0A8J2P1Y9_9HEXA|nr:unnamed protein product [Allacma fusca]